MIKFDNSKNVIKRILSAYKLKTVKSLADKWNMTASVIGSRVQRNTFPSDFVIKCILDTGADLKWLCTGEGEPNIDGIKTEKKSIELSSEALEKLERIAALKSSGAITDDEYQLLKSSIFKRSH
ncbi:helix-turn-helix domain-containing protein [Gilliamella bombi]|uniref:helix-turn-helix domain-containing protein n=1 Tax=Gilliamella bombi TaxID=1908521 RepID=UPI000A14B4C3|nr:helix-turn-helix domain-containing protein [Gilliamella bombi]